MLFNYKMKDPVGMRGPITTFSLDPSQYDRIVMVSRHLLPAWPSAFEANHSAINDQRSSLE